MSWNKKVKKLIKQKGINETEFGKLIGMDQGSVSRMLRKNTNIAIDRAIQIASVLQVPMAWLFDDSKEWPPPSDLLEVTPNGRSLELVVLDVVQRAIEHYRESLVEADQMGKNKDHSHKQ